MPGLRVAEKNDSGTVKDDFGSAGASPSQGGIGGDHRAPARGRAEKSRCEASGRVPRLAVTQSFQGIRWALARAEAHATCVSLEATL